MALMGESWASARIAHEWRRVREPLPGGFDTRPFEMTTNDHGDGDAVERTEGSFGAQKELAARGLTRTMLKVLNQGFTHRLHERQPHFLAAFLRADLDPRVLPVQIIQ